jgi:hypothetical protein
MRTLSKPLPAARGRAGSPEAVEVEPLPSVARGLDLVAGGSDVMSITQKALRSAGFAECDPEGATGDPFCIAYFQKTVGGAMLDVSFWRFGRGQRLQVNFETLAEDAELSLDIGMRGVPTRWSVDDLEGYVDALLKRVRRPRRPSPARAATSRRRRTTQVRKRRSVAR